MRKKQVISAVLLLATALVPAWSAPARHRPQHHPAHRVAADPAAGPTMPASTRSSMVIEVGSGRVMQVSEPVANLFAADPKTAEVRPASPTSVFVFGVAPGRTTIAAMNAAGAPVAQWQVTVRPSGYAASETQAALARDLPGNKVNVEVTPTGLVATGTVATAEDAERVAALLKEHVGEKQTIENRVGVASPQQVNLRVRVAEISRSVTRQLGINWSALGSIGRYGFIGAAIADGVSDPTNPPNTIFAGYKSGSLSLNTVVDLLAQDGLVKILAEPNLTARSGETASFLAGGEFPIPVAEQNNTISVSFKQFGVSLAFVPTVVGPGRISLRVRPEVSELTNQGAVSVPVGFGGLFGGGTLTIPALNVRRAETTVDLGSGQSFAIAGLMQAQANITGSGLPYLGDIPVLGALFRSSMFQRNESELVIIITPYLVNPVSDPSRLATPTDDFVPANDGGRIFHQWQRANGTGPDAAAARPVINAGFMLN